MCVGLPAKVIKVDKGTALIDSDGARRSVSAALIEDLMPGDYVMVHAGAAIGKITGNETDEVSDILEGLL